ncbi:glycoside hydrolase family 43 protein [Sphingobacterium paludis]|uniref:Beta-xylosidase n=1 Tax=Sphingobacterium paludis TaxID=1476465 RepID=A0A4R7D9L9_9SPHI|nr:glycoside hydrolase 43 family protein [Sphingobacterium paludis]TDS17457.1 beta-xylosidase [Sphingobacterium paludis]
MLLKFLKTLVVLHMTICILHAQQKSTALSAVWSPDQGNGTYKNPIIHADYSDLDVCRVGEDYYMTASSFNSLPGLPILHSKDMVNWTIVNHAVRELRAPGFHPENFFDRPQHGNGIWAPAIRYHTGEFYIYYGDPDFGIYMTKAKNPLGEWTPLKLVKAGKGLIDACPFWDEDGQAYLVHGLAGSRARIKSLLAISKLSADGEKTIGSSRIIYDGHDVDPTIEGPKLHRRNGYYYVFAPAGGVSTGWQTILRSKEIFGPYERKIVLQQGNTPVNGPHQGAWVDTPNGEDWFFHFQDVGTIGRIVHLQPMAWKDDWPVIGLDEDGDGAGNPVLVYRKPTSAYNTQINPQESDQFATNQLGLQWQWHANPQDWWHFADAKRKVLSLYSVPLPEAYKNLWDVPNLLLQKMPAANFTASLEIKPKLDPKQPEERTGLLIMGKDYGLIALKRTESGYLLEQIDCYGADKGAKEKINASQRIDSETISLRVSVHDGEQASFSFSTDGETYTTLGGSFNLKEGHWIGAKIGTFCSRAGLTNDGGRVDLQSFLVEKNLD